MQVDPLCDPAPITALLTLIEASIPNNAITVENYDTYANSETDALRAVQERTTFAGVDYSVNYPRCVVCPHCPVPALTIDVVGRQPRG